MPTVQKRACMVYIFQLSLHATVGGWALSFYCTLLWLGRDTFESTAAVPIPSAAASIHRAAPSSSQVTRRLFLQSREPPSLGGDGDSRAERIRLRENKHKQEMLTVLGGMSVLCKKKLFIC